MTFRAVALGNDGQTSTTTSIPFAVPGSVQSGDVMSVLVVGNVNAATYTIAGGGTGVTWTSRAGIDKGNGNTVNTQVWTATASGTSASSTVTVTTTSSGRFVGVLIAESNVLESGVLISGATTTTTPSTTWAFPSVTIPDNTGWTLLGLTAFRTPATTAATVSGPGSFVVEGTAGTAYVTSPELSTAALDQAATVASGSQSPGTATFSTSLLATMYTLAFPPGNQSYTPTNTGSVVEADTFSLVQGMQRVKTDVGRAADTASVAKGVVRNTPDASTAADSATAVKGTARAFTGTDSARAADRGVATGPQVETATSRSRAISSADGAMVQAHRTPVGLNLTTYHIHADGTLHRWMRDGVIQQSTVPGVPNNVTVTLSGTTATLHWAVPDSDGGSDITGYTVQKIGGSTQNLGPAVFSTTFSGVTPPAQFSVNAVNANGPGPAAFVGLATTRYPGDSNPLATGLYMLGIDEADKDPAVKAGNELSAPELLTGRPPSAMRYFYSNQTEMGNGNPSSNTTIIQAIVRAHNRGWIPWVSVTSGAWGTFADAAANCFPDWLGLITYIEDHMSAPVWLTIMHEPESETFGGPKGGGPAASTETAYGDMNREIRRAMDTYANAHGGVGVYVWKYVAFAPIFQAQTYTRTGVTTPWGIDNYWHSSVDRTASASASTDTFTMSNHRLSNGRKVTLPTGTPGGLSSSATYFLINATTNTFQLSTSRGGSVANVTADASGITVRSKDLWDFLGADPYVHPGESSPTPPLKQTLTWCKTPPHDYPLSNGENGINNGNGAQCGPDFIAEWAYLTNGVWDFVCNNYWNIGGDSLTNNGTGGLLDAYVNAAKASNVVNYWQIPRPDGGSYPKPAGV